MDTCKYICNGGQESKRCICSVGTKFYESSSVEYSLNFNAYLRSLDSLDNSNGFKESFKLFATHEIANCSVDLVPSNRVRIDGRYKVFPTDTIVAYSLAKDYMIPAYPMKHFLGSSETVRLTQVIFSNKINYDDMSKYYDPAPRRCKSLSQHCVICYFYMF